MGIWKSIKQYGNLLIAVMMAIGFGGIFMIYAAGAPNTGGQQDDSRELNYELPQQRYTEEGFDRNFREIVTAAAQNDVAIVSLIYENQSQIENIDDMQPITQTFSEKAYVQTVSIQDASDIPTQTNLQSYPAAVVLGGTVAGNGIAPRVQLVEENITRTEVERRVCSVLNNLEGVTAYCSSINAF